MRRGLPNHRVQVANINLLSVGEVSLFMEYTKDIPEVPVLPVVLERFVRCHHFSLTF